MHFSAWFSLFGRSLQPVWRSIMQEHVSNPRGVQLFTCRWLPAPSPPKALVFLCHGRSTYFVTTGTDSTVLSSEFFFHFKILTISSSILCVLIYFRLRRGLRRVYERYSLAFMFALSVSVLSFNFRPGNYLKTCKFQFQFTNLFFYLTSTKTSHYSCLSIGNLILGFAQ